jgi:hypothetical protein
MSIQANFTLRGRNPDVLSCIANLSNDEVFTPPEFANRMLDTLAEAVSQHHAQGLHLRTNPEVDEAVDRRLALQKVRHHEGRNRVHREDCPSDGSQRRCRR